MNNKEKYQQYCIDNKTIIPIFLQPFWLDAVAQKWEVVLVEKEGKVIGALPFCIKGKFITQRIYLPTLSFYQSFIINESSTKTEFNSIVTTLYKQLPVTIKSYFKLFAKYSFVSLNKYGYFRETYHTYIIEPENAIYSNLSKNHQRNIEKEIKRSYSINESKDYNKSYELLISTFKTQKYKLPIELISFKKLVSIVQKNNAGSILDCMDEKGNLLASIFFLKDNYSYYYSLGGYDSAFKNSGGMTCLLWHSIQLAKKENLQFNFCGSNKKTIENYFKGFGAEKQALSIWKKGIL